tara:strand:+ start:986 stop:1189 length:204 start_codon:yes stop_codon:yes gene_type:complete
MESFAYPQPRWDLENENLRLENMIHIYQEEIDILKNENEKLQNHIRFLEESLAIKTFELPDIEEVAK